MMVSKLTMALLAGALALPAAGFAEGQKVEGPKPVASTRTNSNLDKPADCKDKKATVAAAATEKRKKAHHDRGISGEKITHNKEAAREHRAKGREGKE
jgi:hypothetical protein